jgi:pimeloyl-ACP methyl ester carboxylesterase
VAVRLATRTWDGGVGPGDGLGGVPAGPGQGTGGVAAGPAEGTGGVAVRPRGGREEPLALLIHGVTSSSRTWWRVAPELVRRGYRTLAVDLRGHGSSPRVSEGLVLGDLSADVLETLQANGRRATDGQRAGGGVERPAAGGRPAVDLVDLVVGHSLGALVALDLLAKEPRLARRLVLEEPAGSTGVDWEMMASGIEADGRRAREEPEVMRDELAVSNPAWDRAEVERRLEDLADCDTDGVAAALRRTTNFDLVGLANAVRIPTLLVVGLESLGSALVGPDRDALVDSLAGRAVYEVLDDGHNLHREAFPLFMDVLDRWLHATAGMREG